MLESLAIRILETYLGKYVNINADKLSIGLLSGVVELENLPLKTEAFNESQSMPIDVKFGFIGKIKLNISLNNLRNTPWLIIIENLLLVFGPKSDLNEPTIPTDPAEIGK
jgi:vacuolar protein sorting-associated protein 13D